MQVEMGEVFGFIGPNGAGKSTTIKLLMRLIFPRRGAREASAGRSATWKCTKTLGTCRSSRTLRLLTAAEVLELFREVSRLRAGDRRNASSGCRRMWDWKRHEKFIAQVFPRDAAGVGLAQAILHDPKLVILDERCRGSTPWDGAKSATSYWS